MNKARTAKVAVVDGVKGRVDATSTAVVTEYRGLTVAEISSLRRSLRAADAEYKVLKNTLVRRAVEGTPSESLIQFLEGPTAIAWVRGDISAVAKILRDFAKATPTLIVKGGVLDGKSLSSRDLAALADLPSREALLAQVAGLLASPMRQMAGLLKAVPQNFAYGLSALIEARGGTSAPIEDAVTESAPSETPAAESSEAVAEDAVTESAPSETPAAESSEAVAEDAVAEDASPHDSAPESAPAPSPQESPAE